MAKSKISATMDPDRLAEACQLTGCDNVSAVLEQALDALIERERERMWLAAHPVDGDRSDLPTSVVPDLSEVAWDD